MHDYPRTRPRFRPHLSPTPSPSSEQHLSHSALPIYPHSAPWPFVYDINRCEGIQSNTQHSAIPTQAKTSLRLSCNPPHTLQAHTHTTPSRNIPLSGTTHLLPNTRTSLHHLHHRWQPSKPLKLPQASRPACPSPSPCGHIP